MSRHDGGPFGSPLTNSHGPEMVPYHSPEVVPYHGPEVVRHFDGIEVASGHHQSPPLTEYYSPSDAAKGTSLANSKGYDAHGYPYAPEPEKRQKRRLLGVPVAVFWILVAVIVIGSVGLGVGLGVGLSARDRDGGGGGSSGSAGAGQQQPVIGTSASSSSTTTPPAPTSSGATTSSAPPPPDTTAPSTTTSTSRAEESGTSTTSSFVTSGTVGLAANSCNFRTPKTFVAADGASMTQFCFTDWPNGANAADGSGKIKDLDRFTVYTFEDCMLKCLDRNRNLRPNTQKCQAVTYNSNLTSIVAVGKQGGNCFLKDKKAVDSQGTAESASAAVA